ncbi:hypothetical protein [Aeromonas caviae]|uniref:hypothetical protein n=1 Tax=Aeromonas caviae TaxID=648 RepID=UPI000ADDBF47|nr:hypothetical protein [Aeromonas caviae]
MLASAISSGHRLHKYQFNVLILYGFIFPFWQTAAAFSPHQDGLRLTLRHDNARLRRGV